MTEVTTKVLNNVHMSFSHRCQLFVSNSRKFGTGTVGLQAVLESDSDSVTQQYTTLLLLM